MKIIESEEAMNIQFLSNVFYNQVEYEVNNSLNVRQMSMDILRPISENPLPVIVWIAGGGWRNLDKNNFMPQLVQFAQKGYIIASIEHRLTNEAIFPSQIEDVKAAIRFLRANAKTYNIDPKRIGVWGESAGGYLAAMLGTTGNIQEFEGSGYWQEASSKVQAAVVWYAPTDFLQFVNNREDDPSSREALFLGGSVKAHPEKAVKASPLTYISADTPPFLIMHGDQDYLVPMIQSEIFYNALKDNGVSVDFYKVKGVGHFTHGFSQPQIFKIVLDFFNDKLK